MALAANPVSSIAGAVGDIAGSVGNMVSSANNLKAARAQAAAQEYMAGQMTEQQYLQYIASLDTNLTGTVDTILTGNQKTDYLPLLLVGGIFAVIIVLASKKSITI